jgi:putative endonuclease
MSSYRVYVLQNKEGRHYVGLSADVSHRYEQHNAGLSRWTKRCGPWKLLWTSEPLLLSQARKLENKLKRQKGGHGFYKITGLERSGS